MKKPIFTLLSVLFFSSSLFSQPFSDISAGLINQGYSYAAWGDYDRDGDLDVATIGDSGNTIPTLEIYRNDNGTFVNINASLPGLSFSSLEWGDYDNDGDLDLMVTGADYQSSERTWIIRNDSNTFVNSGIDLPEISDGQATWGDFDNDGDLDILMAGSSRTMVLRNDGNGVFTDIVVHLTGLSSASVCWGDYNNDGWLDIVINGDNAGVMKTLLYKNDHGDFLKDSVPLTGVCAGQVKFGDLNNDGYPDLVIAGIDNFYEGHFEIWQNDGNGQFALVSNVTNSITFASLDIGDYDNDGKPDILLTGKIPGCGTTTNAIIYHNLGGMTFEEVDPQLNAIEYGSVTWGDYDGDGYSDILVTGLDGVLNPVSVIYHNNIGPGGFHSNTSPSAPSNLQSSAEYREVTLSWDPSVDGQTPQSGLSYNIFIGTSPTNSDILSPMSDLSTGLRGISQAGNAGMNTSYTVKDLPDGNYFWSVQAVDNGFGASEFPPAGGFSITNTGVNEKDQVFAEIFPNPATDRIYFRGIHWEQAIVSISDITGKTVSEENYSDSGFNISFLAKGLYLVKIRSASKTFTGRFLKD